MGISDKNHNYIHSGIAKFIKRYMKRINTFIIISTIFFSCKSTTGDEQPKLPLKGTWKLITGTLTENGKTTVTDYTKSTSFIKIINEDHFAFLQHDLNKGKDSAAVFVAGGGSYSLKDSLYTEHLEYCNDRQWEGNDFAFTITIANDTLVQKGIEKVESAGINRINMEKYARMK
jgi:hypothetical protein